MTISNALAGVAVRDLDRAIDWYTRLLGDPPIAQPVPEMAEWHFADGGWIQVFMDGERAGRSSITLVEDDLGKRLSALKRSGVSIRHVSDSIYVRTVIVADPDGNQIVFAQPMSTNNRRLS